MEILMRFRPVAAAVAVALLFAGACVSANVTYLGPRQNFAPVPEDDVRVFQATDTVPAACQRFAVIVTAGDVFLTTAPQTTQAARRRAGKIGANAIQLLGTREPGVGTRVTSVLGAHADADRRGQMLAFRCQEPHTGFFQAIRSLIGLAE